METVQPIRLVWSALAICLLVSVAGSCVRGRAPVTSTLADKMIEQRNNPKPKVTRRTKVVIVVVFLAVGLVGLYVGSPLQRFRSSEENACYEKCAKLHRSWRLVSSYPPGTIVQRRYDGPWKCECY